MNKEERTNEKVSELMRIYEALPEEKLKVAADLIEQAAFMAVTLEDLAKIINDEGVTEEYTNGANQSGRKISSNAKMYSTLIGKYTSITSKLLRLVPEKPIAKNEPTRIETEVDKAHKEAVIKHQRQREKEHEFMAAMLAGKICQSDYHAFMAGEIELDSGTSLNEGVI